MKAPAGELAVLTDLDVELGVEDVQQVLDDYLTEDAVAVWDLIRAEPGLTGSEIPEIVEAVVETAEAMEVDQPLVLMAEPMHLPMDTGLPETPVGTSQPELTGSGYTPSLIGSLDTPPSRIMAADNALLDAVDQETPPPDTSKAPGAGRLERVTGLGITSQTWNDPPEEKTTTNMKESGWTTVTWRPVSVVLV